MEMSEATTLGFVLELAEQDRPAALSSIESHALNAARQLRRRHALQDADVEDLAHDALVIACTDAFASLRRRPPEIPLAAWLTATLKNLLRRMRRDRIETTVDWTANDVRADPADEGDSTDAETDSTATFDVEGLIARLPPEQRRVLQALLDEGTERGAADRLGVSRMHVHDVKRRAMRRLRGGKAWRPGGERDWARSVAERARADGDAEIAFILLRHAEGATNTEIAAAAGLSVNSVRGRICRRRVRPFNPAFVSAPPRSGR